MFKILSTYSCWKNIHKMQHLEGSGMPVLYIGRTVLKTNYKGILLATSKLNNINTIKLWYCLQ
jgi:hypothetical protein